MWEMPILQLADDYATQAHGEQSRVNGTPYIEHPRRVALLVAKYKNNSSELPSLISAALLHDTLEDTSTTYYDLVDNFGFCVASLVMELTTNPEMKRGIGNKADYMCYKLKHMTNWALVIKLCDRLDNLSDMEACEPEWCVKYIMETYSILTYLEQNRNLTPTQLRIIEDLWQKMYDTQYWERTKIAIKLSEGRKHEKVQTSSM